VRFGDLLKPYYERTLVRQIPENSRDCDNERKQKVLDYRAY